MLKKRNLKSIVTFFILFLTTLIPTPTLAEDATTTSSTAPKQVHDNSDVEARVKEFFADTPVMIEIARCESGFRQFDSTGAPLNGGSGGMIGVFQVSESSHKDFATSVGIDLGSLEGNISYAKYLYLKQGTDPWLSSFSCWNVTGSQAGAQPEAVAISSSGNQSTVITSDLSLGTISPEVLTLQMILNHAGFTVAPSGPGSVGNETNKFGLLTRDAVRKFQCAQNITCDGTEYTTGYGYVGKRTRTALLQFVTGTSASTSVNNTPAPSTPAPSESAEVTSLKAQISDLESQLAFLKAQLKVKTGQ